MTTNEQPLDNSKHDAKLPVSRSAIEPMPGIWAEDDGLTFAEWLHILKHVLIAEYGFTDEAAAGYVGDGSAWKDYYEEDYSPADAAAEDASYG